MDHHLTYSVSKLRQLSIAFYPPFRPKLVSYKKSKIRQVYILLQSLPTSWKIILNHNCSSLARIAKPQYIPYAQALATPNKDQSNSSTAMHAKNISEMPNYITNTIKQLIVNGWVGLIWIRFCITDLFFSKPYSSLEFHPKHHFHLQPRLHYLTITKKFHHQQVFAYKYHTLKTNIAGKTFPQLKSYIRSLLNKCPDKPFQVGPRCSSLRIDIKLLTIDAKSFTLFITNPT